jgi:hypothetical protein
MPALSALTVQGIRSPASLNFNEHADQLKALSKARTMRGRGPANPLLNGARPESFLSRLCDSRRIARSIIANLPKTQSSFRSSRASAFPEVQRHGP